MQHISKVFGESPHDRSFAKCLESAIGAGLFSEILMRTRDWNLMQEAVGTPSGSWSAVLKLDDTISRDIRNSLNLYECLQSSPFSDMKLILRAEGVPEDKQLSIAGKRIAELQGPGNSVVQILILEVGLILINWQSRSSLENLYPKFDRMTLSTISSIAGVLKLSFSLVVKKSPRSSVNLKSWCIMVLQEAVKPVKPLKNQMITTSSIKESVCGLMAMKERKPSLSTTFTDGLNMESCLESWTDTNIDVKLKEDLLMPYGNESLLPQTSTHESGILTE